MKKLFPSSRERRYKAALTIHLAAYTFNVMARDERAKVDDKVYSNLNGWLFGFAKFEFQRMFSPVLKAAWRAYAMSDLGIPPAIEGESWHLPKSRNLWGAAFTNGPIKLFT